MTRYIPSKSNLQTGGNAGNGLLGTLAVVGCSAAIFMAGVFWLKDMGGASALADLVEHATGTYDWIHAPTNVGHWSEAYPMHKVIPDHGHIAGVDVPTDEGMPQMHEHIMRDTPDVALQTPDIGSQTPHSSQAFPRPKEWNPDFQGLNEAMDQATGVTPPVQTAHNQAEAIISDPAYLMVATEKGLKVVWKAIEHGCYHIY